MSSHPHSAATRPWRLAAVALAAALALVLAAGAWAVWRPLSEHDAARLTARATVEAVRSDPPPGAGRLPDDVLTRQLDRFGPPATPAQQRRLRDRAGSAELEAPTPADLSGAADQLGRLAVETDDAETAASAAAVAASWWAAAPSDRADALRPGAGDPLSADPGAGARPAAPADGGGGTADTGSRPDAPPGSAPPCSADTLAALTALDRVGYTAEAAAAREGSLDAGETDAVEAAGEHAHSVLRTPAAVVLLSCDPPPAAGWYRLPAGFEQDPARSVGSAEHEASEALVRAVAAASSPEQRSWLVAALRGTARSGQVLAPREPVPALPGLP